MATRSGITRVKPVSDAVAGVDPVAEVDPERLQRQEPVADGGRQLEAEAALQAQQAPAAVDEHDLAADDGQDRLQVEPDVGESSSGIG